MNFMDTLPAVVLQRFESLGDNCEFGFVQRANGYEDGGLLRWSISPLDKLVQCLETNFTDLFLFENLQPSAPDMVRDTATGMLFHTKMRSIDGQFVFDEAARREIYTEEKKKMDHLLEKFRRRMRQPGMICVYKRNSGVGDAEAKRLQQSLTKLGQGILLQVRSTDNQAKWGTVEHSPLGFLVGFIDRFAPYSNADQISIDLWNELLPRALSST
jgi:hypothetical protein